MLVLTWIRRGAKDSAIAMAMMLVLNTFDYNVAQANLIIRTFPMVREMRLSPLWLSVLCYSHVSNSGQDDRCWSGSFKKVPATMGQQELATPHWIFWYILVYSSQSEHRIAKRVWAKLVSSKIPLLKITNANMALVCSTCDGLRTRKVTDCKYLWTICCKMKPPEIASFCSATQTKTFALLGAGAGATSAICRS